MTRRPTELLRSNFDALARQDVDTIMQTWAEDSYYDNPLAGERADGKAAVEERMTKLASDLADRGERLVIDRVTEGSSRAVAEWHVEPDAEGRRGVHVVDLDPDGRIASITVYPRA
jgi:hypothetical protein